jgi:hypothetical protein
VFSSDHSRGDCAPFSDRVMTIHARTISARGATSPSRTVGFGLLLLAGLAAAATTSIGLLARRRRVF